MACRRKRFLQLCLSFVIFPVFFFYVIVYLLMLFNEKPLEKANFYASLQGNSTTRCCLPGSFQKLSHSCYVHNFFSIPPSITKYKVSIYTNTHTETCTPHYKDTIFHCINIHCVVPCPDIHLVVVQWKLGKKN